MVANSAEPVSDTQTTSGWGALGSFTDRRRRPRLALQLAVHVFRGESARPLEATIQDISSEGFFCLGRGSFTPGETLLCSIEFPAYAPDFPDSKLVVTCQASVLRTTAKGPDGVQGVACRILDFECSYLK